MTEQKLAAVLFDLDGTLLPMDQDVFTRAYFKLLAQRFAPEGYPPEEMIQAVWAGTAAMVKNDGSRTNEAAFWSRFEGVFGARVRTDRPKFDNFYAVEFQRAREACGFNPKAAAAVSLCRELGLRRILATNPLFPLHASESRARWAGLEPGDFELITSYENSRYCKPNPDYYREIIAKCGLDPAACLMVGNDVDEDSAAAQTGMRVFLLTDCLINKSDRDLSPFPRGDFDALCAFLRANAG